MNTSADSDASGFSLIELTIALVVTLIITGAMYGLLAGGQSAFRREPELSDRQANIRVAMDLIMKDIGNAGSGLPPFAQVFTRNLDACAACNNGGAPMGLGGVRTDELEMLTNDGSRDNEPLCRNSTGWTNNAANIRLARNVGAPVTPAFPIGAGAILFADGTWTMRYVTAAANGAPVALETNCVAGNPSTLSFATGVPDPTGLNIAGGNTCAVSGILATTGTPAMGNANTGLTGCSGPPAVGPCCTAVEINFSQVVRYRIRNDAGGVPELLRYDSATPGAGFQTVARGVEDMQVVFTQADGTVTNGAPAVTVGNYNTLVTQVQVTLSSRSEQRNISGMSADANLGTRLRGSLTYSASPRSALVSLANQGGGTLWR